MAEMVDIQSEKLNSFKFRGAAAARTLWDGPQIRAVAPQLLFKPTEHKPKAINIKHFGGNPSAHDEEAVKIHFRAK